MISQYELCKEKLGTDTFCIAGGAIVNHLNGENIVDLDCFFTDMGAYNNALEFISFRAKEVLKRGNSRQFQLEDGTLIDVVFINADTFKDVIEKFDLVHCCHYFTPREGIVSLPRAQELAKSRILQLHTITLPYLTLGRIAKKRTQGFSIDSEQEGLILQYCYKAPWGPSKESKYLE